MRLVRYLKITPQLFLYLKVFHNVLHGLRWWLRGKESFCHIGDLGSIYGLVRCLGEEMATHSSILAWKIP